MRVKTVHGFVNLPIRIGVYVNLKVPQNIIEISPRGNLKYPYDKS